MTPSHVDGQGVANEWRAEADASHERRGGRPRAVRSLWPKEHGAYAEVALPALAALGMGAPSLAAVLLTVATFAGFAAHEPLVVALGTRGARAKRDHGHRARQVALAWLGLATVSGKIGVIAGGASVLYASILPLVLVIALVPIVLLGREKTLLGEVLTAAALAGASIPVAVASGVDPHLAHVVWATWLIAFATATAAVRRIVACHKESDDHSGLILGAVTTLGIGALAPHSVAALAALPTVVAAWIVMLRPPHPRHLKRVGWLLAGCSVLAAATLVAIVRLVLPAIQSPPISGA
jgi:hypothetical protein